MHDDGLVLHGLFALDGQTIGLVELFGAHFHGCGVTLALDAQHHNDIGSLDGLVKVFLCQRGLQELLGACSDNFHAQTAHDLVVGVGNAGMGDITGDDALEALKAAELLLDGQQVEQRLCGVVTGAIAAVEDGCIDMAQQLDRKSVV